MRLDEGNKKPADRAVGRVRVGGSPGGAQSGVVRVDAVGVVVMWIGVMRGYGWGKKDVKRISAVVHIMMKCTD